MRLLLDTHALHWWIADDERLSSRADTAIGSPQNEVFVSAVSGYELAYHINRGRIPGQIAELAPALRKTGFAILPLTFEHTMEAGGLPGPHRDPWDRMLIAQAHVEGLTVVTADRVFRDYGVAVLW
jgi:PIN domain nuclease of toxin-antitoxin system